MEAFITLIVFAVFFYVMMRFGCGAHVIHGNHNKTGVKPARDKTLDRIDDRAATGKATSHSNKAMDDVSSQLTQEDGSHSDS